MELSTIEVFQNKIISSIQDKVKCFNILSQKKRKEQENEFCYNGEAPTKRWGHVSVNYNNNIIVHGGRYNYKSLGSMFMFDVNKLTWSKVDQDGVSLPASRDSHTSIIYKNDLFIFGGNCQGKRLNDLWKYSFNEKTWTKINCPDAPKPKEGHVTSLILNKYMLIQGGLDETNNIISEMHLFDLENYSWFPCSVKDEKFANRECRSCVSNGENYCFMFGGESNEEIFNDLYKVTISSANSNFYSKWVLEEPRTKKPQERSAHSCVLYNSDFLIISGGEGKETNKTKLNDNSSCSSIPLNDIWIYSIPTKSYFEIILKLNPFDERMFHTSNLIDNNLIIFGGMKDADNTLDTLYIISLDGKEPKQTFKSLLLKDQKEIIEVNQISLASRIYDNLLKGEHLIISHEINYLQKKRINDLSSFDKPILVDKAVDTLDFEYDLTMNFNELKALYTNSYLSWSFLKEQTSYFQWPLGCIMNFIKNACQEKVQAKQIDINMYCIDRTNPYLDYINDFNLDSMCYSESNYKKITSNNKCLCLSIKDNGLGIEKNEFISMMASFTSKLSPSEIQTNQSKIISETYYMKNGMLTKLSALRLGNSLFVITKTEKSLSIGLISKSIQKKLDNDFILIPYVCFTISDETQKQNTEERFFDRFIPQTNLSKQCFNLIFNEIKFIFKTKENFLSFALNMTTGTQMFIFDLRKISKSSKDSINNYELLIDYETKDILYNQFYQAIPNQNLVDCSLKTYIKYYFLNSNENLSINLMGEKISTQNSLSIVKNVSVERDIKESINLRYSNTEDKNNLNAIKVQGNNYNGIIFNNEYLSELMKSEIASHEFDSSKFNNGILIYKDNTLVSRYGQKNLGDYLYYYDNLTDNQNINGFVEVTNNQIALLPNRLDFAEMFIKGIIYSGINNLITYIKK